MLPAYDCFETHVHGSIDSELSIAVWLSNKLMSADKLFKIETYIPESHLEVVKTAMFTAGAGKVGNYECCAWQTEGRGQYRSMEGSLPFKGKSGHLEFVAEFKVEMVCVAKLVSGVIAAMKQAHPYEEVAYSVIEIVSVDQLTEM